MIGNFLAIVPARSGSKGVPKKNIYLINGKPLIAYTIDLIMKMDWLNYTVVSTDSEEIQEISKKFGIRESSLRPRELSGDAVGDIPVLRHELIQYEKSNNVYIDYVLMFQPTSPIRNLDFINLAIEKFLYLKADSLISIKPVDSKFHPYKQLKLIGDQINFFDNHGSQIIARQQLQPTFIRDGVIYCFTRKHILEKNSVIGDNSAYIINPHRSINIDSYEDLEQFSKKISLE